jgi:two-component system sensor histidine kinase UhpB
MHRLFQIKNKFVVGMATFAFRSSLPLSLAATAAAATPQMLPRPQAAANTAQAAAEWTLLAQQIVPAWLAAMLLMMAITIGLLACLHARERHALYLSGMMFGWVAWTLLRTDVGVPATALEASLRLSSLAVLVLCGVQFLQHQMIWSQRWVAPALLLQVLLVPLSLLLLPPPQAQQLSTVWAGLMTLEMLLAMAWYLRLRWRASLANEQAEPAKDHDFMLMSCMLGLAATALLGDLLLEYFNPLSLSAYSSWLTLMPPLLMLALGLNVTVDFARARKDAESRHVQFEQQMHDKVADIERNFGLMVEQKLEQVTERERKRIAADLHDDLGAKLLTIVHTSESDRISTLAREALEEMRLSVRGLTGKPVQLLDALGDWRAEVVSRLGQANILAEWKSPPEDIIHTLSARAYVQTTRIFRESVSNIIKHSGGTHCTVSCNVQDGDFMVVIQDNGQGIPAELDGRLDRGHGMASMKSRAKQMQGQCLVESGAGWGTVIRLTIPL